MMIELLDHKADIFAYIQDGKSYICFTMLTMNEDFLTNDDDVILKLVTKEELSYISVNKEDIDDKVVRMQILNGITIYSHIIVMKQSLDDIFRYVARSGDHIPEKYQYLPNNDKIHYDVAVSILLSSEHANKDVIYTNLDALIIDELKEVILLLNKYEFYYDERTVI